MKQTDKQEPVAWMCEGKFYEVEQYNRKTELPYPNQTPLYTALPQREWVSLTDDEIIDTEYAVDWTDYEWSDKPTIDFSRAIEAKLKEKNT